MRKMKKSLWIAAAVIVLAVLSVTLAFAAEGECTHPNGYYEWVNNCEYFKCDDCGSNECAHSYSDYVLNEEGDYRICSNCGEILETYCEHADYETARDDYWDERLYEVYCDYERCTCGYYFKMGTKHSFDEYDKEQKHYNCSLCTYSIQYMEHLRMKNTVETYGDGIYSGKWTYLDGKTGEVSGEGTWIFDKNGVLAFSGKGEVCIGLVIDKLAEIDDTSETCQYCTHPSYSHDEETGEMIINEHSVAHPSNLLTKNLKKVVLGEGITSLIDGWYSEAYGDFNAFIEEVVLPDSFNSEWCKYEYGKGSLSLSFAEVKLPAGATLPDGEDGTVFIRNIIIDEDSLYYSTDGDGNIYSKDKTVLYRYQGNDSSFTVPDTVTEIADLAFYGRMNIESVILPSSLKKIGDKAFNGCVRLKTVKLPYGLESIGEAAFAGTVIEKIDIPYSVKEIGKEVFSSCMWLEEIQLSEGITEIPEDAFYMCVSLEEMNIPASVKKIGEGAFTYCGDLKNMVVPASVEEIGEAALGGCRSLTEITVASGDVELTESALGIIDMDLAGLLKEILMSEEYVDLYIRYYDGMEDYDKEKYDNFLANRICLENQLQIKLAYAEQKSYNDFLENGYTFSDILTIYCLEGSSAEAYAIENGLNYVATVCEHNFGEWVTDTANSIKYKTCSKCGKTYEEEIAEGTDSGIIVEGGNAESENRFTVENLDNPEDEKYLGATDGLEGNIIGVYDIGMVDGEGNKAQPEGNIKVTLPLDEEVKYVTVIAVKQDGSLEEMELIRDGGTVTFETDDLAYYVILGGEKEADTGDNIKCECFCHTHPLLEILVKLFKILTKLYGGPLTFACDC